MGRRSRRTTTRRLERGRGSRGLPRGSARGGAAGAIGRPSRERRAPSGFAGFGGFGASTAAATGTISVVDGNTLYVLTATGSLVKVTLGPSTTITRNADSSAIDLRPGDTVVVQGTTAANGDVAATSVAATQAGVTSGGVGGRGGGAATTTTTAG